MATDAKMSQMWHRDDRDKIIAILNVEKKALKVLRIFDPFCHADERCVS